MQTSMLIVVLLILSSIAFYLGRRRAFAVARGRARNLHSLPSYYGYYVALWCGLPALLVAGIWFSAEDAFITRALVDSLPQEVRSLDEGHINLVLNDIRNLAHGNVTSREADAARFVQFLFSAAAKSVFESAGFVHLGP